MKLQLLESNQDPYIPQVKELYQNAFPRNERMPFWMLLSLENPNCEFYLCLEEEQMVGFVSLFHNPTSNLSFLSYFVVDEKLRSQGLGTTILKELFQLKKDRRILVDIELVEEGVEHYEEKKKRKQFYLSRGFLETSIHYQFHQVQYEILCTKPMTQEEFYECIKHYWGFPAAQLTKFF